MTPRLGEFLRQHGRYIAIGAVAITLLAGCAPPTSLEKPSEILPMAGGTPTATAEAAPSATATPQENVKTELFNLIDQYETTDITALAKSEKDWETAKQIGRQCDEIAAEMVNSPYKETVRVEFARNIAEMRQLLNDSDIDSSVIAKTAVSRPSGDKLIVINLSHEKLASDMGIKGSSLLKVIWTLDHERHHQDTQEKEFSAEDLPFSFSGQQTIVIPTKIIAHGYDLIAVIPENGNQKGKELHMFSQFEEIIRHSQTKQDFVKLGINFDFTPTKYSNALDALNIFLSQSGMSEFELNQFGQTSDFTSLVNKAGKGSFVEGIGVIRTVQEAVVANSDLLKFQTTLENYYQNNNTPESIANPSMDFTTLISQPGNGSNKPTN